MEILTGNELLSGASGYLGKDDVWVEDLQAARLFSKEQVAERDAALAATKATGRVISLEIEEVEQVNGTIVPTPVSVSRMEPRPAHPGRPAFSTMRQAIHAASTVPTSAKAPVRPKKLVRAAISTPMC